MNSVKKVSIIIPIYNAEKTIRKCINSIAKQTYKNIEIVCVDDGSTDSSNRIVDEMSRDDNRIILLSQQNSGAYMARKTGVLKSSGEYIMFVDADDELINKNAISNLMKYFDEYADIQVLQFGYRLHKSKVASLDIRAKEIIKISFEELKGNYYRDLVGWSPNATISVASCGKIYKYDLVRTAVERSFTRLKLCEDMLLLLQVLFSGLMENMLIIPDVYYRYNNYLGYSQNFDYTVFCDYGNDLKEYQIYLCDKYLPPQAKYHCYMETVYYFMAIVRGLIEKNTSKNKVMEIIVECEEYKFLREAKEYFRTLTDRNLVYRELVFLSSNYTPEEYYNYIVANMPKKTFKKKLMHNIALVLRKVGL